MREVIVEAAIWYAGVIAAFALLTVALGMLAALLWWVSETLGKRLLLIIRFETVRYWVKLMEKEGLTAPQVEYRRMVARHQPKTTRDFLELDRIERQRLMDLDE